MTLTVRRETTVNFSLWLLGCIFLEVCILGEGTIWEIYIDVWISVGLFMREMCVGLTERSSSSRLVGTSSMCRGMSGFSSDGFVGLHSGELGCLLLVCHAC